MVVKIFIDFEELGMVCYVSGKIMLGIEKRKVLNFGLEGSTISI